MSRGPYAVGFLRRYMSKSRKEHQKTVKRVFRYLRGITYHAIFYQGRVGPNRVLDVHGFVDVDWVGDLDHRRYTSGYVFNPFGGSIIWMSKKQDVVAPSITEAKYMKTTHVSKEVVWLQRLSLEFGFKQQDTMIDCDSQSAIFLEKNAAYNSKTRNTDV